MLYQAAHPGDTKAHRDGAGSEERCDGPPAEIPHRSGQRARWLEDFDGSIWAWLEAPRRIEGFDVATLHGGETVASLVVWEQGSDAESRSIGASTSRISSKPMTFASIHQAVLRRYRRRLEELRCHAGSDPHRRRSGATQRCL